MAVDRRFRTVKSQMTIVGLMVMGAIVLTLRDILTGDDVSAFRAWMGALVAGSMLLMISTAAPNLAASIALLIFMAVMLTSESVWLGLANLFIVDRSADPTPNGPNQSGRTNPRQPPRTFPL